ncbi:hypothetical protein JL720_3946 [Aureococcus anophagefferens]|nr:hypothetical protein JL720_3946 [Aureococcus anophagefferens]
MLGRWLWALWSAHNTYAYVRLWYAFLARIDSLQSHLYSVAILLAGATAGGQAVGFVFVPLLVAACYVYQAWLHRSAKGLLTASRPSRPRRSAGASRPPRSSRPRPRTCASRSTALSFEENSRLFLIQSGDQISYVRELLERRGLDADDAALRAADVAPRTRADVVYELAASQSYLECDRDVNGAELLLFFAHFGMRVPQVAAILRTKITRHPDGSETVSRDVFFDAFEVFWTYVFAQLLELYRAATLSTRHTLNELLARHDRRSDGCPFKAAPSPRDATPSRRGRRRRAGAASAVWASKRSLLSARAASPASSAAAPSFVDPAPRSASRTCRSTWTRVSAHLDLEA